MTSTILGILFVWHFIQIFWMGGILLDFKRFFGHKHPVCETFSLITNISIGVWCVMMLLYLLLRLSNV